ncbi:hypothetical protein [Streptomyces fodineus]|uniref:hypothetical protein n=1 Tax=Streptomyces fodineus TaxID=1904616 RepID=UPI00131BBCD1|nr:hypothetical protein [Streptomyces fodineus]
MQAQRRMAEGYARDALLVVSREADLLVVQGRFGLQLGRVTHGVLHHADSPVAVVLQLA